VYVAIIYIIYIYIYINIIHEQNMVCVIKTKCSRKITPHYSYNDSVWRDNTQFIPNTCLAWPVAYPSPAATPQHAHSLVSALYYEGRIIWNQPWYPSSVWLYTLRGFGVTVSFCSENLSLFKFCVPSWEKFVKLCMFTQSDVCNLRPSWP
jgi:hypothetical protein